MRLKLRLYAKDLDLIAIKQNPFINFNDLVRSVLLEYVGTGRCPRVEITPSDRPVICKTETVDVSLETSEYQPVVDWIFGLRKGMKSTAIKALIRASIANPQLVCFESDSDMLRIPKSTSVPLSAPKSPDVPSSQTSIAAEVQSPIPYPNSIDVTEDEILDLDLDAFADGIINK